MRHVVVIGPQPPLVSFCSGSYARQLGERLAVEATALQQLPVAAFATDAGALAGRPSVACLPGADTVIWLRFTPDVYLRDWIAGIVDRLLNGSAAAERRKLRARPRDVCRAALAYLLLPPVDPRDIAARQPSLRVVELNSPSQARFWLRMNEERLREQARP
ncbi:MAG TPA: hypothetical protein VNK91_04030 [Burkholderiaceae bacterium]|jgi:hypothetical protein|nr:hypothetical protein [Burkholderiaceae bacterium]